MRRTWLLPPLILALASPSTASAQGDPAAAAELFRQGREALGQKDYATACPKFAESQRLDPKVGTLINLAQCGDATGKLASALRHWAEAQTLAHSLGDGRESYVVQQHDALLPRVPHLSVHLAAGTPDDARVTIDGTEIAHSDLGASLPVDTGPHVLVVSAAGHADARTEIVANEGVAADVSLNAGPIVPPMDAAGTDERGMVVGPGAPPTVPPADTGGGGRSTRKVLALVAGGVGAVGLGLGTASGVMAMSLKNDAQSACPNQCPTQDGVNKWSTAGTSAKIADVGFIVGGVGLVGGAVLWFTAPSGSAAGTQVGLGPGVLQVKGTW